MIKTLYLFSWLIFHPVHVTLTSIDYTPDTPSLKVFLKIYYDDFQLDCKMNELSFNESDFSGNSALAKEMMSKYLSKTFQIFVNHEQLSEEVEYIKIIDGELKVNFSYKTDRKPKSLTVKNLFLTSLYPDQANMMIVKINDFEEGIKLTAEKTEQTFIIK
jgi:hypothetical protein